MLKSINKSLVKVISFDATDTLIRLKGTPGLIYSTVGKDFGLLLNASEINCKFKKDMEILKTELPCFAFGQGGPKKWWNELVHRTCNLEKNETSVAFVDRLFNELSSSKHCKLINEKVI